MHIRYRLAASALAALSSGAFAEGENLEVATLDTVIVTATRTPEKVEDTLAPVTVITRADIERLQAHSLPQLLTGLPGVSLGSYGGYGETTSLFLRGSNSTHVLVLIDGIKIGSATSGTAALEQIPVDQIERIELVRGPRSSLYGAEAIGGVLQIFTRKGSDALRPSFVLGGGSQGTAQMQAGLSGSYGPSWFNSSLAGFRTSGINTCSGAGAPIYAGCFTDEPDRDGYRNVSGALRAGYKLGEQGELSGEWLRVYGNTHYDGTYSNEAHNVQQLLGGSAMFLPLQWWRSTLNAGQSEDKSNLYENGGFVARFDTQRDSLSWQNDFSLAPTQSLSAGLDYLKDRVDSSTAYTHADRENLGVFTQYQGSFGAHEMQLSLRGDDNQQFGRHYTGGLAWGYAVNPTLRLLASYATAFHAPTFNDLYYPADPVYGGGGNAQLHPEKSRSGELGFNTQLGLLSWSVRAFETRISDLIGYDTAFNLANVNTARIRGVENELSAQWQDVQGKLYASWLDPVDRSDGANRDNTLARRARQTARLDLDRDFGHLQLGTTLNAAGHRYDDAANTQRLGGYATLDLRAGLQLEPHWLLQVQAGNVLDKQYQTAAYYNQLGRTLFLTLRYVPK